MNDTLGRYPFIRPARAAPRAVLAMLAALACASPLAAQERYDRPPDEGGEVYSLGMPPIWKGYAGGSVGYYRPGEINEDLLVHGHAGLYKDLLTPVAGVAALGGEGYGGIRAEEGLDGGVRALFMIPAFRFSTGADYNITDDAWSWLLRLEIPFRRGGILGRGTMVRFDYLPGFDHTFSVGLNAPLWGRQIGETRPQRDAVELEEPPVTTVAWENRPAGLDETVAELQDGALWIAELSMPLLDEGGSEPEKKYAEQIQRIREHIGTTDARFPDGRTLDAQIADYHATLERAFAIALGADGAGDRPEGTRRIAQAAREILLEHVLLPYDRLLGQRKVNDGLDAYRAVGQAEFGRWLLQESDLAEVEYREASWVFQSLVDIAEEVRRFQLDRWEDNRLVWLPLQLALRAEDHDESAEMRDLIGLATQSEFTNGNRVQYVINEEFQFEFLRSVHAAEDYHVLWIHDYRGNNSDGNPDEIAFGQAVEGYLAAIAERVENYDETGKLTEYYIFLDQNYFEANKSRLFFRVLLDPLEYELDLPAGYEEWEAELRSAQDRLRRAVASSRLLQTEIAQFGGEWLENRLKVHISITNPSDFSYASLHVMGVVPVPDNVMRDHRKIAFYDITEEDPYRGRAMFTGMGIGEHYTGPNWEDRAVVIQGPAALEVKDAARDLLEQQGLTRQEMPLAFRQLERPADYQARVDSVQELMLTRLGAAPGWVLQLHNETGFAPKMVNVEKAILYSLMPSGSLLKVPDSLWQSYPYAAMLVGSALRGCQVLIVAPSAATAPSAAAPTLARAHGLLGGLIAMKNGLDAEITAEDGLLKIGLYHPNVGVGDLAGRIRQARQLTDPWLQEIYPRNPAMRAVVDSVEQVLTEAGYTGEYLITSESEDIPKLHLKANFFIARHVWRELMALPEWGPVLEEYVQYLAGQLGPAEERRQSIAPPPELVSAVSDMAVALNARLGTEDELARAMAIFTVGSTNMDYRSMVMDGEVQITMNGWNTLAGLIDFVILMGLSDWVDTQEELNELLPPPSGFARSLANFAKLAF